MRKLCHGVSVLSCLHPCEPQCLTPQRLIVLDQGTADYRVLLLGRHGLRVLLTVPPRSRTSSHQRRRQERSRPNLVVRKQLAARKGHPKTVAFSFRRVDCLFQFMHQAISHFSLAAARHRTQPQVAITCFIGRDDELAGLRLFLSAPRPPRRGSVC